MLASIVAIVSRWRAPVCSSRFEYVITLVSAVKKDALFGATVFVFLDILSTPILYNVEGGGAILKK